MKTGAFLLALACSGCMPGTSDGPQPAPAGSAVLRLGEEAWLGGLAVRALRIEEESRCPRSVQCVQAGTLRLAVRLSGWGGTSERVLRLGAAEPLGGGRFLWLVAACPYPERPAPIDPGAYRFVVAAGADASEAPPGRDCAPGRGAAAAHS